jgi:stage II sporulation protein D
MRFPCLGPARFFLPLTAALAAGLAGCAPLAPQSPEPQSIVLPEVVLVRSGGRISAVPLEDYVTASVLSEVSPTAESDETVARILQVQAVVARTYAVFELGRHRSEGFDLCDTTHCQLYEPARLKTSRFAQSVRAAVARTTGKILTYQGRAAEALFHADCGGYTAGANQVWGGMSVPYLLAAPDEVAALTHRTWQLTVPAEKLRLALNADPRTRIGKRLTSIEIRDRDISGRAAEIVLTGDVSQTVRGEDLRAVIGQALGDRAFLSTRFSVRRTATDYVFSGTGFGHGVGLCQIGAAARARRGDSIDSILGHYFPAAAVVQATR